KALLRPVELYGAAHRLPGVASALAGPLDAAAVLARRDRFVGRDVTKPYGHDDTSQVRWLEDNRVTYLHGHARLAGERRLEVATADGPRAITVRHAVVLASGTLANVPPIPGLREARPWTSREATNAAAAPRRLV